MNEKYVDIIRAMTVDIDGLEQLKSDLKEAALKGKHYCDVSLYNYKAIEWLRREGFEIKVPDIWSGEIIACW